jgi:hypothetical protein
LRLLGRQQELTARSRREAGTVIHADIGRLALSTQLLPPTRCKDMPTKKTTLVAFAVPALRAAAVDPHQHGRFHEAQAHRPRHAPEARQRTPSDHEHTGSGAHLLSE